MYICNTSSGDVKKALKHMKGSNSLEEIKGIAARNDARRFPMVLQVGMVKYSRLKHITNQEGMAVEARRKGPKYSINPNTLTLHKKNCYHVEDHFLAAVLVSPKLTGLRLCKHCMG